MDRRTFLALVPGGFLAAPLSAEAQQADKMPRLGYLGLNRPEEVRPLLRADQVIK
jgi:hypothetical protein